VKNLLTKAEIRDVSDYAEECLASLQEFLNKVGNNNIPTKLNLFRLGDFYWTGEGWLLFGEKFDGDEPEFEQVIKRDEIIEELADMLGFEEDSLSYIFECLDNAMQSKLSSGEGRWQEFDFFGRGAITVQAKALGFISLNESVSSDPLGYIKKLKLRSGEGFTHERGSSFKDLDHILCSEIIKKLKPQIKKKAGSVIGSQTDPFFIPRGVHSVSTKTLSVLSKHRGFVDLSSLISLKKEEALAISSYQGCIFSQVSKMAPEMKRCGFTLSGLESLSGVAANNLSKFNDAKPSWISELDLAWPADYSNVNIVHDFSGLKTISISVLQSLAKLGGHLDLSGIENLEEKQALALVGHEGGFFFGGLQSITAKVGRLLARIKGGSYGMPLSRVSSSHELRFNNLHNISEEVIKEFRTFDGILTLGRIDNLTVSFAKIIKDHPCFFRVEIMAYEKEAKEILDDRWDLEFP